MLEVNLLVFFLLSFPHSGNVRIQMFPLSEVFPTMATGIALAVVLGHMLSKLRFLLEVNRFFL